MGMADWLRHEREPRTFKDTKSSRKKTLKMLGVEEDVVDQQCS